MGEAFGDAYCPADAVSSAEIRQFATGVLQHMQLPSDLEQLAIRILRHVYHRTVLDCFWSERRTRRLS